MSRVITVTSDLVIASRIEEGVRRDGHEATRVDSPADMPPPGGVVAVFVDWSGRSDGWADVLREWLAAAQPNGPQLVLFGSHTDLEAHAAARRAGLGPMIARSKLVGDVVGGVPRREP